MTFFFGYAHTYIIYNAWYPLLISSLLHATTITTTTTTTAATTTKLSHAQKKWECPTWMLNIEDPKLKGSGSKLKNTIWEIARHALEEWTQEELTPTSLYGIRKYITGSILSTHVDRLPLVTSAIINVAQDVDEPWPLEVFGHDGYAVNITMEPGDMILYESHSILHGRPFPLVGRYYANV